MGIDPEDGMTDQDGFWILIGLLVGVVVTALASWTVWRFQVSHQRRIALRLLLLDFDNKLAQRTDIEALGHAPPVLSTDVIQMALPHLPSISEGIALTVMNVREQIDAWNSAATAIASTNVTGVDNVQKRMKYRGRRLWSAIEESRVALAAELN